MTDPELGAVDKITDTHWGVKDGYAEFNWRMIYTVNILFRYNFLLKTQF